MKKIQYLFMVLAILFISGIGTTSDVFAKGKEERPVSLNRTGAVGMTSDAFAKGNNKGRKHHSNPEPLSCILLVAGGATLAALRRFRNRKSLKDSNNQF